MDEGPPRSRPTEVISSGCGVKAILVRWLFPYFLLAALTFLVGAAVGAGAVAMVTPEALGDVAETFGTPDLFPDRLTTWTIFTNNVVAMGLIALGVVSFGLATALGLFFNGLLAGAVVFAGAADGSLVEVLALVLPHGILELGAIFVVGGIAYRVTWRLVSYLRGLDDHPISRGEVIEATLLTLVAVVVLAVAAWIEATLTTEIARAIVGGKPLNP